MSELTLQKITEKTVANVLKSDAHVLVSQTDTVGGNSMETLRRVPVDTVVADLKEIVEEDVSDLKSAISKANDGVQTFYGLGNFQHYGLKSDGTFLTTQKYRVSNDDPMIFERDLKVSVKTGFKWGYIPFVNGNPGSWSGWKTNDITVLSGTSFVVQIARATEITSEIADVSEFLDALTFSSEINSKANKAVEIEQILNNAPTDSMMQKIEAAENSTTDMLSVILSGLLTLPSQTTMEGIELSESETFGLLEILLVKLAKLPSIETMDSIYEELLSENVWLEIIKNRIKLNPEEDETIPSYFKVNLENAITLYRKNAEEIGNIGDSFVFITDTHWGSNQKHSPDLIKYIINKTNLRNVICGGDILDTGSVENEKAKGYDFITRFSDIPGGLKVVIGNHDYNKNGHNDQPEYWLSKELIYGMFYPKAEMEMNDFQCLEPATGYYEFSYYVDVPATNTRYLIVSIPFGSVYPVTISWVKNQLDNNPEKNFVLFSHYLYANGAYPGGANNLINQVKGYQNIKAWIFGHIHNDLVLYTSTGIPLIATDTDSSRLSSSNKYDYTIGTVTEQAFDIITVNYNNRNVECARVGRGKSRRINGGINNVSVSGTATLQTSIQSPTWESSDASIATINNGVVTGIASGSVTITAIGSAKEEYWYIKVA